MKRFAILGLTVLSFASLTRAEKEIDDAVSKESVEAPKKQGLVLLGGFGHEVRTTFWIGDMEPVLLGALLMVSLEWDKFRINALASLSMDGLIWADAEARAGIGATYLFWAKQISPYVGGDLALSSSYLERDGGFSIWPDDSPQTQRESKDINKLGAALTINIGCEFWRRTNSRMLTEIGVKLPFYLLEVEDDHGQEKSIYRVTGYFNLIMLFGGRRQFN